MCDWFEKGFFLKGGGGRVATNSLEFLRCRRASSRRIFDNDLNQFSAQRKIERINNS